MTFIRSNQSLSHVWLFATPWTAAHQVSLSPIPRAYSNSCPSHQWCHPAISSSVVPFSHLQSFPASGSFPMSLLFASGGQIIGASVSASVLPMNIQGWFPLDPGFLPLLSKNTQGSSPEPQFKRINSLALSLLYDTTLTSVQNKSFLYNLHKQSDVPAF